MQRKEMREMEEMLLEIHEELQEGREEA